MKRLLTLLTLAVGACAPSGPPAVPPVPMEGGEALEGPFSVILFIGDGAGLTYWSAAKLSASELAIEALPVVGLVDVEASNSRITDSAAGATAFASGVRTFNGAIGVGPDSTPVQTVLELAESRGMATGLVATATLTHATPAAFAAHVPSRTYHNEIAAGIAERGIDVLLGGGRQFFDPRQRPDSVDLLGRITRRATYVTTPEQYRALNMDTVRTLVGLFAENNPPPAGSREPALAELTRGAIDVLARDRDGFFLMVEGSQIDWRGHENAPLREVIAEVLDFDLAIREALRFQGERRSNTLIVVVADHSTGGLALHADAMGVFRAHYTTEGHTAEMVPLFAGGPGAAAFGGVKDNDVVGRLLLEMVARGGPARARARASTESGAEWIPSSQSPRR
ncbi:MAG TPA: alkaline phosphatase [Longimicrobiales bacterium]|nr:alkaline phosphatase [Longimicrobiales bacterium]